MTKKKVTDDNSENHKKKVLYDFGYGWIDPNESNFFELARGMGIDPKVIIQAFSYTPCATEQTTLCESKES